MEVIVVGSESADKDKKCGRNESDEVDEWIG